MPCGFDSQPDVLAELTAALRAQADALDMGGHWPAEQLDSCGRAGVFRWFLPRQWGGWEWSDADAVRGYLRLSAACLTTTFIITQRTGACRRILASENDALKALLLPDLASGQSFATVGISHLTTSRRHLAAPAMRAIERKGDFVLDGFSPWVTGGQMADTIVLGATLDDGRQILIALPTDLAGVEVAQPVRLVALAASHTGEVRCRQVQVGRHLLLAGPVENVMAQGIGARTGGLETSTLAVGLAAAAIEFLQSQAELRAELMQPATLLHQEQQNLENVLIEAAQGSPICSTEQVRARANSLVLRCTQAALAAAKGTGFVMGHPAGRWCREALFFLVWSCPQPVLAANLCELAGISD